MKLAVIFWVENALEEEPDQNRFFLTQEALGFESLCAARTTTTTTTTVNARVLLI